MQTSGQYSLMSYASHSAPQVLREEVVTTSSAELLRSFLMKQIVAMQQTRQDLVQRYPDLLRP